MIKDVTHVACNLEETAHLANCEKPSGRGSEFGKAKYYLKQTVDDVGKYIVMRNGMIRSIIC